MQLVDAELGAVGVAGEVREQVAQRAVDSPCRWRGAVVLPREAGEFRRGDREFVEAVGTRLVDPWRLGGGAHEA